jgi:hypothetical protein
MMMPRKEHSSRLWLDICGVLDIRVMLQAEHTAREGTPRRLVMTRDHKTEVT